MFSPLLRPRKGTNEVGHMKNISRRHSGRCEAEFDGEAHGLENGGNEESLGSELEGWVNLVESQNLDNKAKTDMKAVVRVGSVSVESLMMFRDDTC